MVIAIDGPAGAGKGTIASLVAAKLGLVNIDTGAMYRALTLAVIKNSINKNDESRIIELAKTIKIEFDENNKIYLNDIDVSEEIRNSEVSNLVSEISSIKEVREIMVDAQRDLAKGLNVIMEGRDITTVVFPKADYKFYLDASVDERAHRRYIQNKEKGLDVDLEEIKKSIEKRDYIDMHKEVGALKRCNDQIYIDSTNMTIDEVVDFIVKRVGEVK